jgi:hypothetical protein
MEEPPAELVAYSCPWHRVPDADLVRLTAAAGAAGHRRDGITGAQIAMIWALPDRYRSAACAARPRPMPRTPR